MAAKGPITFEFRPNLGYPKAIQSVIEQAVNEVLEADMLPDAVASSPFDTGNNARSINTKVIKKGNQVGGSIFSTSGYGGFLEIGTAFMRARAYLRPAVEKNIGKLAGIIRGLMSSRKG